jgi:hypothetical protein
VLLTTPKEMVSANGEDFFKILAIHQVRLSNPFRASFRRNGRIFSNDRRMANMVDRASDFDTTGAWNGSELDVRFIAKEVCRGASKYIIRFAHCSSRVCLLFKRMMSKYQTRFRYFSLEGDMHATQYF